MALMDADIGYSDRIPDRRPAPPGIGAALQAEGGRVTLARFMDLALTHPAEGYYARADRVLGRRGDFSTAPSLSPAFNEIVGRLVAELAEAAIRSGGAAFPVVGLGFGTSPHMGVVELGGGEGHLAQALLGGWDRARRDLRRRLSYCIVEVGIGLRRRQESALSELRDAGWDVRWGAELREACGGVAPAVIVGNEFIDAIPVHVVDVHGPVPREAWVASDGGLVETWGELSPGAESELTFLFETADAERLRSLTRDGIIELRPGVARLMAEIAEVMPSGSLVTIDYGEWHGEPVGPGGVPAAGDVPQACGTRPPGSRRRTLRGYFRHQMTCDPLARAGRQDLTADVDFAALDLHGRQAGFETVVFTSLAAFLAAGGAGQELAALREAFSQMLADPLEADRQATVLEALLDEEGLGGSFKVMVQVRG
jgi:SAM-dependent MidA family methyltransferase